MPCYLIAIHHPDDYDPATAEDAAMHQAIDALNDAMVAAGVRIFVGGLQPAHRAQSIRLDADGHPLLSRGPYLPTKEHVGGFWVIEVTHEADAMAWGTRAARACRAPVEVRAFN
ncbi:YciI family protein [Nitrogeniibacter aestuarii]|uniref:YciI family protein n=1 Tax=Nitrogeniibacter aestuarii TaxID=2815343 RepID=UPI001D12C834|nr:YciI family protein [Nitrogeniibacter aestuarii]